MVRRLDVCRIKRQGCVFIHRSVEQNLLSLDIINTSGCLQTTMEKERFFKVYANLPLNLRNEVILVLPDKGPITWQVAYLEINNNTEVGEKIFNQLVELNIV